MTQGDAWGLSGRWADQYSRSCVLFLGGLGHRKLLLEPGLKISLGADVCSLFSSLQASVFHEAHLSIGLRGHGREISPTQDSP